MNQMELAKDNEVRKMIADRAMNSFQLGKTATTKLQPLRSDFESLRSSLRSSVGASAAEERNSSLKIENQQNKLQNLYRITLQQYKTKQVVEQESRDLNKQMEEMKRKRQIIQGKQQEKVSARKAIFDEKQELKLPAVEFRSQLLLRVQSNQKMIQLERLQEKERRANSP